MGNHLFGFMRFSFENNCCYLLKFVFDNFVHSWIFTWFGFAVAWPYSFVYQLLECWRYLELVFSYFPAFFTFRPFALTFHYLSLFSLITIFTFELIIIFFFFSITFIAIFDFSTMRSSSIFYYVGLTLTSRYLLKG